MSMPLDQARAHARAFAVSSLQSLDHVWRELEGRALESLRHEDSLTNWMVSLSTGAVVAIGPALNVLTDLAAVPRWRLLSVFGGFVVVVLVGILHRVSVHRAATTLQEYVVSRSLQVYAISARAADWNDEEFARAVNTYLDETDPDVQAADRASDRWETIAGGLMWGVYLTFFVSIALLAWLAVDAASGALSAAAPIRPGVSPPTSPAPSRSQ